jgi:hypothetical protein
MEDVDFYPKAPDPQGPVVCFDESPHQLSARCAWLEFGSHFFIVRR